MFSDPSTVTGIARRELARTPTHQGIDGEETGDWVRHRVPLTKSTLGCFTAPLKRKESDAFEQGEAGLVPNAHTVLF
jgi:hypothetical protein